MAQSRRKLRRALISGVQTRKRRACLAVPSSTLLADFRVGKFGVSVNFMRQLGSSKPLFDVSSRRAIVVASEEVFGTMRLAIIHTAGAAGDIRVFRDMAEARRWLNLAENSAEL